MNPVKKTIAATKEFVSDHKVAIAVVTTAAITVAVVRKMQVSGLKEAYEFIEAKGLNDDFLNSTHLDN